MSAKSVSLLLETLKNLEEEPDTSHDILGRTFDTCLKLNDLIENSDLPTNETLFQDSLKICIKALEKCTRMVNELDLFSDNEAIEEVQTSSIRYLMLPALLGHMNLNLQSKEKTERYRFLEIAEVYFKDFLLRCKNYELSKRYLINKYENEAMEDSDSDDIILRKHKIIDLSAIRERKIQQYVLRKEIKEREDQLKPALERQDAEEEIREYYILTLERWMLTAIEELGNIKSEKSVLKGMIKKRDSPPQITYERRDIKPLKPIIITRNEIQKKVFGLGYPSLPVLTIDDFYQQRFEKMVKEHRNSSEKSLQDMAMTGNADKEAEDVQKETLLDKDDFETLQKARAWDDWKDDNPRGSGNRKNKG